MTTRQKEQPRVQKEKGGDLNLEAERIDHTVQPFSDALKNIQGNILKGHDRNSAILFFLKFVGDPGAIKKQIAKFAKMEDLGVLGTVTSASLQMQEYDLYHKHRVPGGTFANFFLTAKGYEYLDFSTKGFDEKFRDGMQESGKALKDSVPRDWDSHYQDSASIHAMLMIADDEESTLGQKVRIILRDVLQIKEGTKLAEIIGVEHAFQQRNTQEQPIEHFGFRDGISNPYFLKSDEATVAAYGGAEHWKPWAPLKLVLVDDPLCPGGYGSYLVLRKLEQHVRHFETIIRTFTSDTLGLNPNSEEDLEYARALLLGRFRDGTPLSERPTPYLSRYGNENYNNFNYADDTLGNKCPFHAHIRKMNPRNDPQGIDKAEPRIVRRGITYGRRNWQREKEGLSLVPNTGVGLLFMCFQRDIKKQFESLQSTWANDADFPDKRTGLDPIAGQFIEYDENTGSSLPPPPPQQWPLPWGKGDKRFLSSIQSCVTLKGGEYFFAPSISFLKNIDHL